LIYLVNFTCQSGNASKRATFPRTEKSAHSHHSTLLMHLCPSLRGTAQGAPLSQAEGLSEAIFSPPSSIQPICIDSGRGGWRGLALLHAEMPDPHDDRVEAQRHSPANDRRCAPPTLTTTCLNSCACIKHRGAVHTHSTYLDRIRTCDVGPLALAAMNQVLVPSPELCA
jgi:hypothetical protein